MVELSDQQLNKAEKSQEAAGTSWIEVTREVLLYDQD